MVYVEHTLYGLECDECGRRTRQDGTSFCPSRRFQKGHQK